MVRGQYPVFKAELCYGTKWCLGKRRQNRIRDPLQEQFVQ